MEKKRLLIYAHYYVPDTASTGQILRELAEGLLENFEITVICVVPSYLGNIEEKYKEEKYYKENINRINVLRVRVPEFSKSSKISRIKNIITYFFRAMIATYKVGNQDFIFSISQPPILGGLLGVWGKWVKRARYIYNIQDFNPEQIMAVSYSKNKMALKTMMVLDKFSCRRADKVIVVGRDMVETLKNRFNSKKIPKHCFINNWIDEEEIFPLQYDDEKVQCFKELYGIQDRFVIMYSGNIGLYYDLENIIKVIQKFPEGTKTESGKEVVFAFVGAGSMLEKLVRYKEKNDMNNVTFIPYQNKADLNYSLNAGDVHWVVNSKGIKGVSCPSKMYGVMGAGKPVLGVLENRSECQLIIGEANCGLCCEPEDYKSIEKQIKWFIDNSDSVEVQSMGMRGREYLENNLTKNVSVKKYAEEMLRC